MSPQEKFDLALLVEFAILSQSMHEVDIQPILRRKVSILIKNNPGLAAQWLTSWLHLQSLLRCCY